RFFYVYYYSSTVFARISAFRISFLYSVFLPSKTSSQHMNAQQSLRRLIRVWCHGILVYLLDNSADLVHLYQTNRACRDLCIHFATSQTGVISKLVRGQPRLNARLLWCAAHTRPFNRS